MFIQAFSVGILPDIDQILVISRHLLFFLSDAETNTVLIFTDALVVEMAFGLFLESMSRNLQGMGGRQMQVRIYEKFCFSN